MSGNRRRPSGPLNPIDPEVVASEIGNEFSISLWPRACGGDGYKIVGTRHAIEDSGLAFVPSDFQWPDPGQTCSWTGDGMSYDLRAIGGSLWQLGCCTNVALSQRIYARRKAELQIAEQVSQNGQRLRDQAARTRMDAGFQRLLMRVLPPLHRIPRCYVI